MSDIEEIMSVCHRYLVLHNGKVTAELPYTATQEELMAASVGVEAQNNMKKETNVKEFLMKYGFVIILILVTAFFGITTNNFITVKNLFSILHNAAPVFAFCVGARCV